jgi:alkanesulfonate monooxygenase SsuD/methylene tetrahydromethanopterin reductase-like flavin-dependent oxidoreductase (luciferase family)
MNIVTNMPASTARKLVEYYWSVSRRRDRAEARLRPHIVVADTDEAALAIARRGYRGWYASFMKLWLEHGTRPAGVVYPRSSTATAPGGA